MNSPHWSPRLRSLLLWAAVLAGSVMVLAPAVRALGSLDDSAANTSAARGVQNQVVTAEVMHWWTSSSEGAAIEVLRSAHLARGGEWSDGPQPSRDELRHALVDRFASGLVPAAVLWQGGSELTGLADLGMLRALDDIAQEQRWDEVLPSAVRRRVQSNGHYYIAPTNVHIDNWVFYNLHALQRYGVAEPRNLDELLRGLQRVAAAGGRPVAVGANQWEYQNAINSILMGALGTERYRRLVYQRDASVLEGAAGDMAMQWITHFRDLSRTSRPYANWSEAARAVARGEAVATFMGDWAKGEIESTGARPQRDFGCLLTGGENGPVALTVDGFLFPALHGRATDEQQRKLAATMMDRDVQHRFGVAKGAVAARIDAQPTTPDACEQLLRARLEDAASSVQSPTSALVPQKVGPYSAALTEFYRDGRAGPAQLREKMRTALTSR